MSKIEFQVRWRISGEVQPPLKFRKKNQAHKKAIELSKEEVNTSVQMGEIELGDDGEVSRVIQTWDFEKGEQTGHQIRDGAAPFPEKAGKSKATETETQTEGSAEPEVEGSAEPEVETETGDEDMKTKKGKKAGAKAPAKTKKNTTGGKASSSPKEAKKPKASAKPERVVGKAALAGGKLSLEVIRSAFGTRTGTNREKLLDALYENRNKTLPISALIKSVYGSRVPTEEGKSALKMVMKGIHVMIEKHKLPFKVIQEKGGKDGKEICYGLDTTGK